MVLGEESVPELLNEIHCNFQSLILSHLQVKTASLNNLFPEKCNLHTNQPSECGGQVFRWRWLLLEIVPIVKNRNSREPKWIYMYSVTLSISTRQFFKSGILDNYCTDKLHAYLVNDWKLFIYIDRNNALYLQFLRLLLCLLIEMLLIIGVYYRNLMKVPLLIIFYVYSWRILIIEILIISCFNVFASIESFV